MASDLTSEEFLAGIFAMLAQRDWVHVTARDDRLDRASAAAFEALERVAPRFGSRPLFYVVPHPTYGESTVIRDAVAKLAQWDLVSLMNPEFQDIRFKMTPSFAREVLARLELDPALFSILADAFMTEYESALARA